MLRLTLSAFLILYFSSLSFGGAQTPSGWKSVVDQTGVCRMSVPGNWVSNPHVPGNVSGPDSSSAMILASASKEPVHPMGQNTQNVLGVGKMFENTKEFMFYAGKPTAATASSPSVVGYHVEFFRNGVGCTAQITERASRSGSEDEAKKIAASVSSAK
jgi:hypothetical protein